MKRFSVNRVQVHEGGIRDGLLLREIGDMFGAGEGRRRGAPDRLREVRRFAAKCNYEKPDSEHVAMLALRIFDQLSERLDPKYGWLFAEPNREILEAAAVLRDVGYLVNYARHHKHTYHLIVHSDIGGFSPREVELIANIARYHRRSLPKRSHPNFENLAPEDRHIVRALAAILRIADGLDRTHTQSVTDVGAELDESHAYFRIVSEASPSVNIWGAERKAKLFTQVFGREPVFRWASEPEESQEQPSDNGAAGAVRPHPTRPASAGSRHD
jgi:exopolyphosphatase/guanosine-5'-triphosphate,3'-diphosphate pyrophosphatase